MVGAEKASPAGIYSVLLGDSTHATAAEIRVAEEMIAGVPSVPRVARANRDFLLRAVRTLAAAREVGQFLDIGSGIPGAENVHQVVHSVRTDAKIVYSDIDPRAVEVAGQMASDSRISAVHADLREPDQILSQDVIDWTKPVAVLLVAVLHFLSDEEAYPAVATIRDALAPGSVLVISHAARESFSDAAIAGARKAYAARGAPAPTPRSRADVERLFGDFSLIPPGIVPLPHWHPVGGEDFSDTPLECGNHCGVAIKL